MNDRHILLAQVDPAASVETDALVVENSTTVKLEGLMVCNRSGTATSFRIWLVPLGQPTLPEHAIYYDLPIDANDTFLATLEATLRPSDVVRVYATNATLSFTLFGTNT